MYTSVVVNWDFDYELLNKNSLNIVMHVLHVVRTKYNHGLLRPKFNRLNEQYKPT